MTLSINQIGSDTRISLWVEQQPVAKPIKVPEVKQTETIDWVRKPQTDTFYTQKEEPWLVESMSRNDPFITEQLFEAGVALRKIEKYYQAFRKQLVSLNPDLAYKNWGFTLNHDTSLKVTDPQNTLTAEERSWLFVALNNATELKASTHRHAKAAMALVEHDAEEFGGKYKLDLSNFHKTIDYGQLLTSKNNLMKEWINQVHASAEKSAPEKIDIIA